MTVSTTLPAARRVGTAKARRTGAPARAAQTVRGRLGSSVMRPAPKTVASAWIMTGYGGQYTDIIVTNILELFMSRFKCFVCWLLLFVQDDKNMVFHGIFPSSPVPTFFWEYHSSIPYFSRPGYWLCYLLQIFRFVSVVTVVNLWVSSVSIYIFKCCMVIWISGLSDIITLVLKFYFKF